MSKTKAAGLLIAVFAARGTSFLFSKTLMRTLDPLSILAVRFTLAFLLLALVFCKRLRAWGRNSLRGGVILGVLYTVCMVFEMFGLRLIERIGDVARPNEFEHLNTPLAVWFNKPLGPDYQFAFLDCLTGFLGKRAGIAHSDAYHVHLHEEPPFSQG